MKRGSLGRASLTWLAASHPGGVIARPTHLAQRGDGAPVVGVHVAGTSTKAEAIVVNPASRALAFGTAVSAMAAYHGGGVHYSIHHRFEGNADDLSMLEKLYYGIEFFSCGMGAPLPMEARFSILLEATRFYGSAGASDPDESKRAQAWLGNLRTEIAGMSRSSVYYLYDDFAVFFDTAVEREALQVRTVLAGDTTASTFEQSGAWSTAVARFGSDRAYSLAGGPGFAQRDVEKNLRLRRWMYRLSPRSRCSTWQSRSDVVALYRARLLELYDSFPVWARTSEFRPREVSSSLGVAAKMTGLELSRAYPARGALDTKELCSVASTLPSEMTAWIGSPGSVLQGDGFHERSESAAGDGRRAWESDGLLDLGLITAYEVDGVIQEIRIIALAPPERVLQEWQDLGLLSVAGFRYAKLELASGPAVAGWLERAK